MKRSLLLASLFALGLAACGDKPTPPPQKKPDAPKPTEPAKPTEQAPTPPAPPTDAPKPADAPKADTLKPDAENVPGSASTPAVDAPKDAMKK